MAIIESMALVGRRYEEEDGAGAGGWDVTRTQFKFPFLNFYERCL